MANISQNVNIELLEKLPDGTYKRKYPKTRSDTGVTFDEHLADYATPHKYEDEGQDPNWSGVRYRLVMINGEPFMEVVEI